MNRRPAHLRSGFVTTRGDTIRYKVLHTPDLIARWLSLANHAGQISRIPETFPHDVTLCIRTSPNGRARVGCTFCSALDNMDGTWSRNVARQTAFSRTFRVGIPCPEEVVCSG
jgi:hypothetical protein